MKSPRLCIPMLLIAPILAGCGTQAPDGPAPARAELWCDGYPVMVVQNNTRMAVEIVESRRYSSSRVVIGEVSAGQHRRLTIRGETGYSYFARPAGGEGFINSEYSGRTRQVLLTRACD